MLERLSDVPERITGVRAVGKLTREDEARVLDPAIDEARRAGRRLRLLYQAGPEFKGYTAGAAWHDAKLGLGALPLLAACAIVTDDDRIRRATRVARFLLPCPIKVFPVGGKDKAVAWLGSIPHEVGATHRMLRGAGVLVIEAARPLRIQDFEVLATTIDPWVKEHGKLQGVVLHARKFPGWENFGSLLKHVQFVRAHHREVRRIAFAADGELVRWAPRLAERFLETEVKTFRYDEIDAALTWAGGAS